MQSTPLHVKRSSSAYGCCARRAWQSFVAAKSCRAEFSTELTPALCRWPRTTRIPFSSVIFQLDWYGIPNAKTVAVFGDQAVLHASRLSLEALYHVALPGPGAYL